MVKKRGQIAQKIRFGTKSWAGNLIAFNI